MHNAMQMVVSSAKANIDNKLNIHTQSHAYVF